MHEAEARLRMLADGDYGGDDFPYGEWGDLDGALLRADLAWLLNERDELEREHSALTSALPQIAAAAIIGRRALVLAGVKAAQERADELLTCVGPLPGEAGPDSWQKVVSAARRAIATINPDAIADAVLRALNAKECIVTNVYPEGALDANAGVRAQREANDRANAEQEHFERYGEPPHAHPEAER